MRGFLIGCALALSIAACGSSGSSSGGGGTSGTGATSGGGSPSGGGGSGGGGGVCQAQGSDASFACGTTQCSAGQICVQPCCGGAPTDAEACKPAPPFCASASDVQCTPCGTTGNCVYVPDSSCAGGFLEGAKLNCLCG